MASLLCRSRAGALAAVSLPLVASRRVDSSETRPVAGNLQTKDADGAGRLMKPFWFTSFGSRVTECKGTSTRAHFETLLQDCRVLDGVSKQAIEQIARSGDEVVFNKGEVLIQEGELNDCLFVIGQGDLAVEVRGDKSRGVKVADLRGGQVVGEYTMVLNKIASATVRVESDSAHVLLIDHKTFRKTLDRFPEVFTRVEKLAKEKTYGNAATSYLCDVVSFHNSSEEFLVALSACLKPAKFRDGTQIVVGGKSDTQGMFFITKGVAGVENRDGGGNDVAQLKYGEFFGEGMLLRGGSRSHTLTARGDLECYQLSQQDFERIARQYPDDLAEMRKISNNRQGISMTSMRMRRFRPGR